MRSIAGKDLFHFNPHPSFTMQTMLPAVKPSTKILVEAPTRRVALALASPIDTYFRRVFDGDTFAPAQCHWLNADEMSPQKWPDTLIELQPEVLITGWGTPQLPESYFAAKDCSLRYICHLAGGVRWLVPRPVIERGVLVSNWGHSISYTVAEHAVLLVLGLLRNLPEWGELVSQWPKRAQEKTMSILSTRSLRRKRVGIHGFGAVAREMVAMMRPFRPELMAYSEGVPHAFFHEHKVRPASSLEELFASNEIIIECEALTPKTRGIVNESLLRLLPWNAIFVNVGRGAIVDEKTLTELALEGRLKVGMDVYQQEPISSQHPLFDLPNTLLSPHLAGPTEDAFADLCGFAAQNLQCYFEEKPLEGLVSLEVYDRSS